MDVTEAIAWEDLAVMWLELDDPPEYQIDEDDPYSDETWVAEQAERFLGEHADR